MKLFDNYPFKLTVIQQLMYEQEVSENKYRGGGRYFEIYTDAADVSAKEFINRLKPYIEEKYSNPHTYIFELLKYCSKTEKPST